MNILDIQQLSVAYQGVTVLDDISVAITRGAYVAVVGPNGSGKTTLLKAVLGLVPMIKGSPWRQ